MTYVAVAALVFGVNLMPVFGPPTWALLALFRLRSRADPVALVAIGAPAAALGRYVLAAASRRLRGRLSPRRIANLDGARARVTMRRSRSLATFGLFALSPVPSAQLFEAAGLMDLRLGPVVAFFFAGRLVSYSAYVSGASALKRTSFGHVFASSLTSPWGIGVQLVLLAGIAVLTHVDWSARLGGGSAAIR